MNGALAKEARVCGRCGYETFDDVKLCARCGARVLRASTMRALGWLLVVLGSMLLLIVGFVTFYAARVVYHTGEPGAREEFTGSPAMAFTMFAVFGFLMIFGLACVASGAWQARYARPNRKLMLVVIGLGVLFAVAGRVARLLLHH